LDGVFNIAYSIKVLSKKEFET